MPEEPKLQQGKARSKCVSGQAEVLGSSSLIPAQLSPQGQWPQNRAGALAPGHRVHGFGGCTSFRTLNNIWLVPKGGFLRNLCVSQLCIYQPVFFTIMCEIQGTLTSKILCKVILFLLIPNTVWLRHQHTKDNKNKILPAFDKDAHRTNLAHPRVRKVGGR